MFEHVPGWSLPFLQGNVNLISSMDGTVEFLQGRNFKPNLITDNECKRLCIATKVYLNCLPRIFIAGCLTDNLWKSVEEDTLK